MLDVTSGLKQWNQEYSIAHSRFGAGMEERVILPPMRRARCPVTQPSNIETSPSPV
jgi:hypothetical protein